MIFPSPAMDFQWQNLPATRQVTLDHLIRQKAAMAPCGNVVVLKGFVKKTFKDFMDIHNFMEYGYNIKIAMNNTKTILR